MTTAAALTEKFGNGGPQVTARAPGRVNLIGEHTDYNDGFVLPAIVGFQVEVSGRRQPGTRVRLLAIDFEETMTFELGENPPDKMPGWASYLFGLTEELRRRGLVTGGFDLAVSGTVPLGAGLSSSAALETAAALTLEKLFGFELDPLAMVQLCRDVEHDWAGVACGIMDQMASRLGRPDQALCLDCRDLSHRPVPLDLRGHSLVLVFSGVRRRLGDSAYNTRRRECEEGVTRLKEFDPAITSLRDVATAFLAAHLDALDEAVARRCRHVVEENARVLAAADCLSRGNLTEFGRLMTASHQSLRDLYEASHPAVDRLVDAALETPGVLGSRLTGAGWGGCTVTLCATDALAEFSRRTEEVLGKIGEGGSILRPGPVLAAGLVEEMG